MVAVSAKTGQGIDLLTETLQSILHDGKHTVVFHIPNREGGALNTLYREATVEDVEYGAGEMIVTAVVDARVHGMLRRYDPEWKDTEED